MPLTISSLLGDADGQSLSLISGVSTKRGGFEESALVSYKVRAEAFKFCTKAREIPSTPDNTRGLLEVNFQSSSLRPPLAVISSFAVAISLIVGCQSPPPPKPKTEQATISGTVTLDGKPIPANCDVVFTHDGEGVTIAAKSDALGKFTLRAMDPRIGIPAGTYRVAVRPPSGPPVELKPGTPEYEALMKNQNGGTAQSLNAASSDSIPTKYHQYETSELVVTAKAGPNEVNLELSK